MEPAIYHIYDKIFKKILTLSSTAVVNLINGLFGTNHPADSTITYNWTEFENEELKKTLADTILTINGKCSYHMEAQISEDETIIMRVFDYGYGHAVRTAWEDDIGTYHLYFPEPKVIYLYSAKHAPDEYKLELDFGNQGTFLYKVSTCKFQEISTKELNARKMIILIPFTLLRVRKLLENERTPENLELLKKLIQNDIIGSINENLAAGNIKEWDARKLRRYTHKLYEEIYSHYEEMEELNEMTDESLMLDVDIIEKKIEDMQKYQENLQKCNEDMQKRNEDMQKRNEDMQKRNEDMQKHHEDELNELKGVIAEKDEALIEKRELINRQEDELIIKNEELDKKEKEIKRLKEALRKAGIQM